MAKKKNRLADILSTPAAAMVAQSCQRALRQKDANALWQNRIVTTSSVVVVTASM